MFQLFHLASAEVVTNCHFLHLPALEMKLYFQRFIHHISGLPDFSALKFTRYNQYESLILPMKKYLEDAGVEFQFNTEVTNVIFDIKDGKKVAKAIDCKVKGVETGIVLTENDLVFVTNGSCTEGTIYGDQNHAPNGDAEVRISGCWSLWKNIAKQDPAFGHPEKFCSDITKTMGPTPFSQCGNGCRLPIGLCNIGTEFFRMSERRILFCNVLPQAPAATDPHFGITVWCMVLIAVNRTFGTASVCDKYQIIFGQNDSGLYTFYFAVNGFCHFLSIFDIKNNVRYFGIELKLHTGILKIFLHRKNQGFVLVIACKFQCREIRQSGNMVDKPLEIQFHLQCLGKVEKMTVPLLSRLKPMKRLKRAKV